MAVLRAIAIGIIGLGVLGMLGAFAPDPVSGASMAAVTTPSPAPSAAPSAAPSSNIVGDTRSVGEGPGLVGAPFLAIGGVIVLGLVSAGLTLLYVRATDRGRSPR
ncbi:MAG: hypothetical protein ACYDCI_12315 [Candidatus Limnocylindrales bacterium]